MSLQKFNNGDKAFVNENTLSMMLEIMGYIQEWK